MAMMIMRTAMVMMTKRCVFTLLLSSTFGSDLTQKTQDEDESEPKSDEEEPALKRRRGDTHQSNGGQAQGNPRYARILWWLLHIASSGLTVGDE
jgi:hypothetical protein